MLGGQTVEGGVRHVRSVARSQPNAMVDGWVSGLGLVVRALSTLYAPLFLCAATPIRTVVGRRQSERKRSLAIRLRFTALISFRRPSPIYNWIVPI